MSKIETLEREVVESRRRLSDTLEELRYRAQPRRLVDDTFGYLRSSGGGHFLANLKADLIGNPAPVALLAAGLLWLALYPRSRDQKPTANGYASTFYWAKRLVTAARQNASQAGAAVQLTAAAAREQASSLARRTSETASALSQATQQSATATKQGVAAAVTTTQTIGSEIAHSASAVAHGVSSAARGSAKAIQTRPLLFAATALAIGGAAALAFASTRAAREEISRRDRSKERGRDRRVPAESLVSIDEADAGIVPADGASVAGGNVSERFRASLDGM